MSMAWAVLIWGSLTGALAADLLEETRGVVGRGVSLSAEHDWAVALIDAGQWDEAMLSWQGIALSESNADAALWAIVCAVRAGDPQAAQAATFMAMDIARGDPRVLLTAAWLLNEGGAHKEASKLVEDYPLSAADADGAVVLRLRALMMSGKIGKSLRVRRRSIEAGVDDAWFWFELGLEDAWRREPEADAHMRRAIRSEGAGPAHYRLLVAHLAEQGDSAAALEVGLEGLVRFSDSGTLGLALLELVRFGEGRAALDALVSARPDHAVAQAVLGTVLLADADPVGATDHLRAAVAGGQDQPAMYRMLAEAHLAAEQHTDAWDVLAIGIEHHPEEPVLWQDLYRVSYDHARQDDALNLSEDAWQRGVHSLFLVDFAYQAANDMDQLELALQWSDRGLGIEGRGWQGLSQRALALTRLGRGREALSTYEEALQLRPSEPQLLNNLAWFLLEPSGDVSPDPARARSLAEAAVEHASEPRPAYLDTLARALWEQGEHRQAVELQRQAAALAPGNESIRNTLQQYETSE
jgi:predicted Zn-dependent protease